MGQGLSCVSYSDYNHENGILKAVQLGDLDFIKLEFEDDPLSLYQSSLYDRHSLLHIASAHGQIHVRLCFF